MLTGGEDEDSSGESSVTTVTRYNMQGQTTTLPSLNTGRSYHACGTIKKSDGTTVSMLCHDEEYFIIVSLQFYIVTGGNDGSRDLASTEIMKKKGGYWQTVASLPSARIGLGGVSLPNGHFMVSGDGGQY